MQPMPTVLPVDAIRVMPGHNPRTFFDDAKFNDLVESIRADGLIQPICVRRSEDESHYELIAGERRWRAMQHIGIGVIPALVVDVDDRTAQRMALVENVTRADLTIPEEARAARSLLTAYEGDQEATAKALGWSLTKLRHRLLLLHAAEPVMEALIRSQISVGHAELLAPLPHDKQESALPLIIERGLTIAQVREQILGKIALALSQARFDTAGCQGCPHNSDVQSSLFEAHIGGGQCSNRACYTEKTGAWVQERKAKLNDEFGTVALLTEHEPGMSVALLMAGDKAVGPEQFDACKACASYGAILDDRVGPTLGREQAPMCFNTVCHAGKVDAYQATLNPPAADTDDGERDDESAGGDDTTVVAPARSAAAKAKPKAGSKPAAKATVAATPGAVIEHYDRALRDTVVEKISAGTAEPILALAVYGLSSLVATCSTESHKTVLEALGVKHADAYKHTGTVAALVQMEKPALQSMLLQAAKALFTTKPESGAFRDERLSRKQLAGAFTKALGWDVLPHVRVDDAFLAAHTKAGLEHLMVESGFRDFYSAGEGGAKKYKALLAMGKGDMVKAILAAGFDFSSYMPSGLTKHQRDLAKTAGIR